MLLVDTPPQAETEPMRGPRRDALPHRGVLLTALLAVSYVCACATLGVVIVAFGRQWLALRFAFPLPGAVGFIAGVACWRMARDDYRRVRRGEIEPAGLRPTVAAGRRGMQMAILNVAAVVFCVGLLVYWRLRS